MSSALREHFWVFGHPTNSLVGLYGIEGESALSPVDSLPYFGATNLFWVPMWLNVDKEQELELAKQIPKVCWSINNAARCPENVTEIVNLSKKYPNLCSGIFDDFFSVENPDKSYLNYTPASVRAFREELNAAGLELWVVLYAHDLDERDPEAVKQFIAEFDGVTFWFWKEQTVIDGFDAYVERFLELSQGKRKMIGCYLHDFGDAKQADPDVVISQLEKDRLLLKNGDIDAVILHTNAVVTEKSQCIMDRVRAWMQQHGDEPIA